MTEKGSVLIVDDDPVVRNVLLDILGSVGGYRTDVAVDGLDGIEKLKQRQYDIVFTDLTMPRMNGMDLLRETKKLNPAQSVVVITGFSTLDNAINAMKEGARDFITKPFKINTVVSIADRIVGEKKLLGRLSEPGEGGTAMERLNKELFRSLYEIGIFHMVSTELDGIFNNREVYESLVDMASRLLNVREASFGIVDNGSLKVENALGTTVQRISINGTVLEKVISAKSYYIAPPGELNPHTGAPLSCPFFSIPFIMNDEVFGILNLANKADGTAFTDYEISLAAAFAKKAALRIENNALYEVFYNNLVNTLKSLVTSIEARDSYTKQHSERVTSYSLQIAEQMEVCPEERDIISFGGYLHDIGKIGVRDTVLLKPGRLTEEEMLEIKLHPVIGDNIIKPIKFFPRERELIRNHHEHFDGTGYPDGLAGNRIPLIVRIIKIADTYDAMTSSRPYRKALSHEIAIEELKKYSWTQFDGDAVHAFLRTPAGRGETLGF
ncbi:MAG: response regulator [Nitrospiraceae bacterium]|nr:response regulator [Nitrospiraceae bacterium]